MESLFSELHRIVKSIEEVRTQPVNGLIYIQLQETIELVQEFQDNLNKYASNLESEGEQPKEIHESKNSWPLNHIF